MTPDDAQLPDGHYVPRKVDPILIYPRPDDETPEWAKHRRHHPGVPYRVPIGISFGSWPYFFEAVELPTGCTVGAFLTESGDALRVGEDYGVVECTDPVEGTYPVHVRVHFQDDYTPIDVRWTLEVTTSGTIVIDPQGGDDATGDGSIDHPFRTINAWWRGDLTDRTFSGYQVLYRGGTHVVAADNTTTGVTGGNWRLGSDDKPLVHYGHPDETVVFDMSDTTIVLYSAGSVGTRPTGSDAFFSGIIFEGAPTARDNARVFSLLDGSGQLPYDAATAGGSRITWFENTFRNYTCETTSTNNSGVFWSPNAGTGNWRHYLLISRNRFTDIDIGDCEGGVNFNGFYLSKGHKVLEEHTVATRTRFGRGTAIPKSTGMYWAWRNLDYTAAPAQQLQLNIGGSYEPEFGGLYEVSYSRLNVQHSEVTRVCVAANANNTVYVEGDDKHPIFLVRNTLSRAPVENRGVTRILGGWPVAIHHDLWVGDEAFYLGGRNTNEGQDDITLYSIGDNPLDAELNLAGAARAAHLGTEGAEVAR